MKANTATLLLICTMLMSILMLNPEKSLAETENDLQDYSEGQKVKGLNSIEQEMDNVETYANWKKVFFKGTLVGWFVDGAIEYVTGTAPSDWVVMRLQRIKDDVISYLKTPLYSQAMVNSQGKVSADCVVYPCPIFPYSEKEDEESIILSYVFFEEVLKNIKIIKRKTNTIIIILKRVGFPKSENNGSEEGTPNHFRKPIMKKTTKTL